MSYRLGLAELRLARLVPTQDAIMKRFIRHDLRSKLKVALSVIWCLSILLGTNGYSQNTDKDAQNHHSLTFQYMPNDLYDNPIGLGWYMGKERRFGFYLNGQFTALSSPSDRDDYYESLNVDSFGDPVVGSISDLLIFNLGTTFLLTKYLGVYAGVGYADVTGYAEKFDPMYILDSDGGYLVRDKSIDDSGVNGNLGLILRLKWLALEAGYNSFVEDAYFGIGFAF